MPDSAVRLVVAALALGFVAGLLLAWVFDWTPTGPEVTGPRDASDTGPGPQRAPNLVIAGFVVVAALAAAWLTFRATGPELNSTRSVAVMPFRTLGQSEADAFTDGIHVGVITRLSAVADLDVISRTSVLALRDSDQPLPALADALDVNWVVNVEVQQVGEEVLISARLVDARTDRQVWAEDYRRRLSAIDVFAVQGDIAGRIIDGINARLTNQEQRRVELAPTQSLDAYRLNQQGRLALERRTGQAMGEALAYFEQALTIDPQYAPAWAGVAETLSVQLAYGVIQDKGQLARAKLAIDRALALDPGLAEAWVARGLLEYLERRSPAALAAYERAVALRPGYAQAHSLKSFQLALQGQQVEAVESARQAVRLNPLAAEAWANLAAGMLTLGRWEEARDAARRTLELAPNWPNARFTNAMVLFHSGDPAAAAAQLEGLSMPWTGAGAEMLRGRALVRLGREAEARALLPTIEAMDDDYALAALQAALGERDAAFERLKAIETWDDWSTLTFRNLDGPLWNPAGDDERYAEVLDRVDASWGIDAGP